MSNIAYQSWLNGIVLTGKGDDNFPLQKGSKGQRVTRIQMLLNRAGAGLKEDGDFGAKTEAALKTYYGATSVADQSAFDKLYRQEAAKNHVKPATQTLTVNNQKVEVPKNTKEEFDAMLKVDYSNFANLAQLGAALQTMQSRILAHAAEKKKQEAALGPYSYTAATTGKWKGKPYGLFTSLNAAADYMAKWKAGVAVYERVKKNYEKRQAEYRNSSVLKAAKLINEVKDKVVSKAKNLYASFKKWALSGTETEVELGDGGLISGPVLIVAGIAITAVALTIMAGFVVSYSNKTALDAEDLEKAMKENEKLIAGEEKDRDELYKKAEEAKAKGDAATAKQFTDAAIKKEESISELKKENVEALTTQQEITKLKAKEGGIFTQLGDNAGKVALAAGGLLLIGLAWQNRDAIKERVNKKQNERVPEPA